MLENFERITSITIPSYIREVEISKSQNPKYFEWNGITIKCKNKPLWKKCIAKGNEQNIIFNNNNIHPSYLNENYFLYCKKTKEVFNSNGGEPPLSNKWIVAEYEGDTNNIIPVIANPTKVGKPNKIIISGQYIYNSTYNVHTQGKIINAIKESYARKFTTIDPLLLSLLRVKLDSSYPILLIAELQDTVKRFNDNTKKGNGKAWDVGNFAYPYLKTFSDFLVNGYQNEKGKTLIEPFIEDDDRLHIMGELAYFTPIDEFEERKLIFHIYQDTREIWKQYQINKEL